MKLLIAVLALAAVGLWPPLLAPAVLVADGITATFEQLPLWFLALAAVAAWAHRKLATRPRPRVVRGTAFRKA